MKSLFLPQRPQSITLTTTSTPSSADPLPPPFQDAVQPPPKHPPPQRPKSLISKHSFASLFAPSTSNSSTSLNSISKHAQQQPQLQNRIVKSRTMGSSGSLRSSSSDGSLKKYADDDRGSVSSGEDGVIIPAVMRSVVVKDEWSHVAGCVQANVGGGRGGGGKAVGDNPDVDLNDSDDDAITGRQLVPQLRRVGLKLKYRYPLPSSQYTPTFSSYILFTRRKLYDPPSSSLTTTPYITTRGKGKRRSYPIQPHPSQRKLAWKRRWMLATANKLYFLKSPTSREASLVFNLDDVVVDPRSIAGFPHSFRVMPPVGTLGEMREQGWEWMFVCEGEESKMGWICAVLRGAGWREQRLAERGKVPMIVLQEPEEECMGDEECQTPPPVYTQTDAHEFPTFETGNNDVPRIQNVESPTQTEPPVKQSADKEVSFSTSTLAHSTLPRNSTPQPIPPHVSPSSNDPKATSTSTFKTSSTSLQSSGSSVVVKTLFPYSSVESWETREAMFEAAQAPHDRFFRPSTLKKVNHRKQQASQESNAAHPANGGAARRQSSAAILQRTVSCSASATPRSRMPVGSTPNLHHTSGSRRWEGAQQSKTIICTEVVEEGRRVSVYTPSNPSLDSVVEKKAEMKEKPVMGRMGLGRRMTIH
ncbi:hypothetical protein HDV05_004317 [Chytridiales sp. JEL 0842]|nr:hypothetical protein HDV05_004317 [Chytridiales sp. JEL 0842]